MADYINNEILELSPYDDSFPAKLLQHAFELQLEESDRMINHIYHTVTKKSGPLPVPTHGEEKLRLVVDVSDDFIQDYKDGIIKLSQEKGKTVAQLRKNGSYGEKLPIKEESYIDGPDALQVSNALQLKAIQESLSVISEQIKAIDQNVKEVLSGQQNDRLGLYYSGAALYLESTNVSEKTLQKQLAAQSLKTLTDASFQLTLNIKSDIQYLKNKGYDTDKKNKINLIQEKMKNIDQSFTAIHQASILRAGIYFAQGELKAAMCVLKEYSRFIEGTIAENAYMLSQCDTKDNGKNDGLWKGRAGLHLDVSKVMKQLSGTETILYIEKEDDENEGI